MCYCQCCEKCSLVTAVREAAAITGGNIIFQEACSRAVESQIQFRLDVISQSETLVSETLHTLSHSSLYHNIR